MRHGQGGAGAVGHACNGEGFESRHESCKSSPSQKSLVSLQQSDAPERRARRHRPRLRGDRGYIDAHQAAGVYMVDDANAIMYCAGVRSSSNGSSTTLASVSAALWITGAGGNCLCHVPVNKEYRPHGIDCERGCKNRLLTLLMLREICSVSRLSRRFQSLLLKKYDSGGKIT